MHPLQAVETKRLAHADEMQKKRQSQNAREKLEWERRFVTQENEARKREHAERLKQLSVSFRPYQIIRTLYLTLMYWLKHVHCCQ